MKITRRLLIVVALLLAARVSVARAANAMPQRQENGVALLLRGCEANLAKFRILTLEARELSVGGEGGTGVSHATQRDQSFRRAADGKQSLVASWFPIADLARPMKTGGAITDQFIWTGRRNFFTAHSGSRLLEASVSRNPLGVEHALAKAGVFAPALGIIYGDDQPFPLVLRRKHMAVSVSSTMTMIGRYKCLHLRAAGPAGRYSLWVSPACGYAIVRAVVRRAPGDIFFGKVLGARPRHLPRGAPAAARRVVDGTSLRLYRVVLAHEGGAWFPQRFRVRVRLHYIGGAVYSSSGRVVVKQISLTCNQHSLQFRPNIPDGAKVWKVGHPTIQYIWHNGKVVPAYDKAGIKKLNRDIDEFRRDGAAYFTAPRVAGVAPEPALGAARTVAAVNEPVGDPVARSTGLWEWCIAAAVSTVAATLCVLFMRKNNSQV